TALARKNDRENALFGTLGEERVFWLIDARHDGAQQTRQLIRIGTRRKSSFLGAAEPRRGDKLHRASNLLGVFHRADTAPKIEQCGHCELLRPFVVTQSIRRTGSKTGRYNGDFKDAGLKPGTTFDEMKSPLQQWPSLLRRRREALLESVDSLFDFSLNRSVESFLLGDALE